MIQKKTFSLLLFLSISCFVFAQDSTNKITIFSGKENTRIKIGDTAVDIKHDYMANYYLVEGERKGKNEDYKGAIDDFSLAIIFDLQDAEAFYNRGLSYYYLGDYKSAITDISSAISFDSTKENYFIQRGICYSLQANYPEARIDFAIALRLNPDSPNANLNMGVMFLSTGNYEEACPYLNTAKKLGSEKAGEVINKYCK